MPENKIPTRLTISNIPIEYIETYLNICDGLDLTREQLFMLLMSEKGLRDGGLKHVFPDNQSRTEWVELLINRMFKYANSSN